MVTVDGIHSKNMVQFAAEAISPEYIRVATTRYGSKEAVPGLRARRVRAKLLRYR